MIHALMVSVNYADFLAWTLPQLKQFVDSVTVITSWEDPETYEIASTQEVSVLRTDAFTDGFCKGRAINEALHLLPSTVEWLLHLDADICLTEPINTKSLDRSTIYGAVRHSVKGQRGLRSVLQRRRTWRDMLPCKQDEPFLKERYRMRGRTHRRKLLPPGFFQLWHSSCFCDYPHQSFDASLDDILHAERFPNAAVLPSYGVYHLETEDHDLKANWQGRTTRRF